ncbi:MAG: hypothetical protein AAFR18_05435 [Cyanobacteria bacterium J06627_32]
MQPQRTPIMYDLTQLTFQDVTEIGSHLRKLGQEADSLETVADRCVRYLRECFIDPATQESACALSRFFKTYSYGQLPGDLQQTAQTLIGQPISDPVKCLTLMGTAGDQADWCDRTRSQGHQAIPLTSEKAVEQIPMISQLIKAFDLDISCVLAPDPHLLMALESKTCNVFHIPNALGSEFIPAQQTFVEPYGIRSVIGFGGMLPSGELFAIILFTKVVVPAQTAQLFKVLPLNIKMAIAPFLKKDAFRPLQPA